MRMTSFHVHSACASSPCSALALDLATLHREIDLLATDSQYI